MAEEQALLAGTSTEALLFHLFGFAMVLVYGWVLLFQFYEWGKSVAKGTSGLLAPASAVVTSLLR